MDGHFKTIVLGAGPCGLGAATRLHQHGEDNWVLIDQAPEAGGLGLADFPFPLFLSRLWYISFIFGLIICLYSEYRCNRGGIFVRYGWSCDF